MGRMRNPSIVSIMGALLLIPIIDCERLGSFETCQVQPDLEPLLVRVLDVIEVYEESCMKSFNRRYSRIQRLNPSKDRKTICKQVAHGFVLIEGLAKFGNLDVAPLLGACEHPPFIPLPGLVYDDYVKGFDLGECGWKNFLGCSDVLLNLTFPSTSLKGVQPTVSDEAIDVITAKCLNIKDRGDPNDRDWIFNVILCALSCSNLSITRADWDLMMQVVDEFLPRCRLTAVGLLIRRHPELCAYTFLNAQFPYYCGREYHQLEEYYATEGIEVSPAAYRKEDMSVEEYLKQQIQQCYEENESISMAFNDWAAEYFMNLNDV